jgi:hypothetical protein
VFTTLVAVDKFVVPYYARHRTLEEVRVMRDRFATDKSILALSHLPDSVETRLKASGLHAVVQTANAGEAPRTVSMPLDILLSMPLT